MPDLLTIDDLETYVGRNELTQVAGIGSHNAPEGRSLDEDKINASIAFASDTVKGYFQKRYPIVADLNPDQVPDLIKGHTAAIARYHLRPRSGNRNTTTDEVRIRYEDAMKWLRDVSHGRVNVDLTGVDGGADAEAAAHVDPNGTVRIAYEPTRAPQILQGFLE